MAGRSIVERFERYLRLSRIPGLTNFLPCLPSEVAKGSANKWLELHLLSQWMIVSGSIIHLLTVKYNLWLEIPFDQSTMASASPKSSKRSRVVSFDSVHIHEHKVVLGDNPSVSSGLPVALGGRASTDVMDVDEYEEYERRGQGRTARVLSKADRAKIVRGTHTFFALRKAKREVKRIQKSREESFRQHVMSGAYARSAIKAT